MVELSSPTDTSSLQPTVSREFSNSGEVNFVWDDITVVLGEIEIMKNILLNISQERRARY